MSDKQTGSSRRTPRHLWIIGGLSIPWNAMGAFDYLMTQTHNQAYMGQFTPEQLDYFYGFPSWVVAFWAIAVWGGVLGSILLLLKKKWAVEVFLVSFVAMVVTTVYSYGLSNGLEVVGHPAALAFSALIFVVALLLYLYARAMRNRGVLA
ncbi:MAG: hypothetical protein LJF04_08470 [Gemmatimonadetes bacterium]|nr:hypothetical protein [Gemmatimonadota bacterium]